MLFTVDYQFQGLVNIFTCKRTPSSRISNIMIHYTLIRELNLALTAVKLWGWMLMQRFSFYTVELPMFTQFSKSMNQTFFYAAVPNENTSSRKAVYCWDYRSMCCVWRKLILFLLYIWNQHCNRKLTLEFQVCMA